MPMPESVLRDDVNEYEPRPIFGHSYRAMLTFVVIVALCALVGLAGWRLGAPDTLIGFAVLAIGGAVGFVGIGRPDGLKFETWWRVWSEDRAWRRCATYSAVVISTPSSRAARRAEKRPRRAVETEIDPMAL